MPTPLGMKLHVSKPPHTLWAGLCMHSKAPISVTDILTRLAMHMHIPCRALLYRSWMEDYVAILVLLQQ